MKSNEDTNSRIALVVLLLLLFLGGGYIAQDPWAQPKASEEIAATTEPLQLVEAVQPEVVKEAPVKTKIAKAQPSARKATSKTLVKGADKNMEMKLVTKPITWPKNYRRAKVVEIPATQIRRGRVANLNNLIDSSAAAQKSVNMAMNFSVKTHSLKGEDYNPSQDAPHESAVNLVVETSGEIQNDNYQASSEQP